MASLVSVYIDQSTLPASLHQRFCLVPPSEERSLSSEAAASPSPAEARVVSTNKRRHQTPELIVALKTLVNAGIEKEEAVEEVEQAQKSLKEAQQQDEAAEQVATAARSLQSQGFDWNHHDTV